jgi:hypothetical protein
VARRCGKTTTDGSACRNRSTRGDCGRHPAASSPFVSQSMAQRLATPAVPDKVARRAARREDATRAAAQRHLAWALESRLGIKTDRRDVVADGPVTATGDGQGYTTVAHAPENGGTRYRVSVDHRPARGLLRPAATYVDQVEVVGSDPDGAELAIPVPNQRSLPYAHARLQSWRNGAGDPGNGVFDLPPGELSWYPAGEA